MFGQPGVFHGCGLNREESVAEISAFTNFNWADFKNDLGAKNGRAKNIYLCSLLLPQKLELEQILKNSNAILYALVFLIKCFIYNVCWVFICFESATSMLLLINGKKPHFNKLSMDRL